MGLVIRVGVKNQAIWPGGVIPYEFDDAFSADNEKLVKLAMIAWMERTSNTVLFDRAHGHPHRLRFTCPSHSSCAKGLDTSKAVNECQINPAHDVAVSALHELGHCIGLGHEQLRDDTPSDVKTRIATSMARGGNASAVQFQMEILQMQIQAKKNSYTKVGAFDPTSIMLYSSGNTQISDGDVAAVRTLYGRG